MRILIIEDEQELLQDIAKGLALKGYAVDQADNCYVLGQDRLLERVFYNLLENAVKYSPPGTCVQVTAKREGDRVRVQVADQGEGIP